MDIDRLKFDNKQELRQVAEYGYVVVGDSAKRASEIEWLLAERDRLAAERDELQRRLDAVVMEHIRTAELKCYCEFNRDHERTLECEYCEEVTALRAIAEGKS